MKEARPCEGHRNFNGHLCSVNSIAPSLKMRFQASTAGLWLALGSLATAVLSPGVVALVRPVQAHPSFARCNAKS